jgi:putative membrane protein
MSPTKHPAFFVFLAMSVTALALTLLLPGSALASLASEQREGAKALKDFNESGKRCSTLSKLDFEHIGDYLMGRMAGSTSAHQAMDDFMAQMMGEDATDQMHVALGQRYTGCGTGTIPSGFRNMMGFMSMMGGVAGGSDRFGSGGPGGRNPAWMMGNGAGGSGSMMGGRRRGDDSNGVLVALLIALGVVLVLAAAGLGLSRPWRRHTHASALDVLAERFARGELNEEEYERRRAVITRQPGSGAT